MNYYTKEPPNLFNISVGLEMKILQESQLLYYGTEILSSLGSS